MNGKSLKGQGVSMAGTFVVLATALIIGVLVFATIFPAVSNVSIVNDTYTGTNGLTTQIHFSPVAPDEIGNFALANCTNSGYTVCTTMNTSNYTVSADGTALTFNQQITFATTNYTSGRLPTAGQAAATTSSTNTFSAFTLGAIVLIVVAAALILRNVSLF